MNENNQARNIFPMIFSELFEEFDSINRENYKGMPKYPPIDSYINEDGSHTLEIATTFRPEDIKVDVEDNLITIEGKNTLHENEEGLKTRRYIHKSISRKSFTRAFKADYNIDKKSVSANFENGLLTINFKSKASKKVNINVKSSGVEIPT